MILLRTIGAVDIIPGTGPRRLPAPKAYVTVVIAWAVLALASDAGAKRVGPLLGWIMVLAAFILGPFASAFGKTWSKVSKIYGIQTNNSTSSLTSSVTNHITSV